VTGHPISGVAISGHEATADTAVETALVAPPRPKKIVRLKKNVEFRAVAKGRRFHGLAFTLQAARRAQATIEEPRVGFTVTRKTGDAVERNRMRRRLKEALRLAPDLCVAPDHDYVLVIRRAALSTPFPELIGELTRAFRDIANRKGRRPPAGTEQRPVAHAAS
jgi:ribonuclease P protein component